ncbi:MAG: hypothetical protein K0U78_20185 [Actinomycetia bacterium]|nr:hypothetical protein [Actinomycetes bacterium]
MRCAKARARQPDLTDRLYWVLSRLVNHGWRIYHLGLDGSLTVQTPGGDRTKVSAHSKTGEPALEQQACRLLQIVAGQHDGHQTQTLATVAARLRLSVPAGRPDPDDQSTPWRLPAPLWRQPGAPVRHAYWAATTLTDDYRWQLSRVSPNGFDAIVPGSDTLLRYRADEQPQDGTTARRLAHLLAAMEPAAVDELGALLNAHDCHRRVSAAQAVAR